VTVLFATNGVLVASFIARVPDVQADRDLSESVLGLVLTMLFVGVLAGIVTAGRVVGRAGSRRRLVGVGAATSFATLAVVGWLPSAPTLAVGLAVLGAASSVMDIGMNTQGVDVERRLGRPIMVGLHAAWSAGALLGAGAGALATAARSPVPLHLGVVALALAVAVVPALVTLSDDRAPDAITRFALPRGPLVPIALVAMGAALGENVAGDWSGIHLRDTLGVAPARMGWGYVALTASMLVIRLAGDRLAARFGPAMVMRFGAGSAGLGFVVAGTAPGLPVALLGLVLVGLGVGAAVPLAFAAAGRVGDPPGAGIAAVATVAYAAFLVGPPLVGVVAQVMDLRVAFVIVGVLVAVLGARRVDVAATSRPASHGPTAP
jgi:MFS family permease